MTNNQQPTGRSAMYAAVTAAVIAVGAAAWTAANDRSYILTVTKTQGGVIDDHEQRLRTIERQTEKVAADVTWIRSQMELRKD